jgi:hypothetical protein
MIGYPFTWKAQLKHELREAEAYLRRAEAAPAQASEFEDASAWLERLVLIAAFTTRRLMEADELSAGVVGRTIPVLRFERLPSAPAFHPRNRQEFALHYDGTSPAQTSLELRAFANMLIHSYVLMNGVLGNNHGKIDGLVVTSDRASEECCYYVELKDLLPAIEAVTNDGFPAPYEPPRESFPAMLRAYVAE